MFLDKGMFTIGSKVLKIYNKNPNSSSVREFKTFSDNDAIIGHHYTKSQSISQSNLTPKTDSPILINMWFVIEFMLLNSAFTLKTSSVIERSLDVGFPFKPMFIFPSGLYGKINAWAKVLPRNRVAQNWILSQGGRI